MEIEESKRPNEFLVDVTEDRECWHGNCESAKIIFCKTAEIKHGACHAVEINGEIKVVQIFLCENRDAMILYGPRLHKNKPLIFLGDDKKNVKILGVANGMITSHKVKGV